MLSIRFSGASAVSWNGYRASSAFAWAPASSHKAAVALNAHLDSLNVCIVIIPNSLMLASVRVDIDLHPAR
jgi:hypothetical protein